MANIKLHTAIAVNAEQSSQLCSAWIPLWLVLHLCGLSLVILILVIFYQISRPQEDLDTEPGQDLIPETSQDYQISEPAAATPASTRPALQRRNCFTPGRNVLISQLLSSGSSPASSPSSDSEGYLPVPAAPQSSPLSGSEGHETAPEEAAPGKMAEKGAVAYFKERLRRDQDSVSPPQTNAPTFASQAALTNAQIKDGSHVSSSIEEEDVEMVKRRNVKMREEGVRVNVTYAQLAAPTRSPPHITTTGTANGYSPPWAPKTPPSLSTGSSTSAFLSGLQSPAPTPCSYNSVTGASTPEHQQQQQASVLPASGNADEILYRIDEKLLAVPADAVSRRLLRDGRALLHRKKRQPRSASFVSAESGQSSASAEGQLRSAQSLAGYPSELIE